MADPTIYDIARVAGVGIATVSRVVNGTAGVAPGTRAAVERAVVELGYRPNRSARQLAAGTGDRPRVAAFMSVFTTAFYTEVGAPLAAGLAKAGIDLVILDQAHGDDQERHLDRLIRERACEVVLMFSGGLAPARCRALALAGIRLICVDHEQPGTPSVWVDNRAGGRLAAAHLRACGVRHPAVIAGPGAAAAAVFTERVAGFLGEFPAAPMIKAKGLDRAAGAAAVRQLCARHPDIDGIACVADILAVGALEHLRAAAIAIPETLQVIGFDDLPLMDVIGLSTIRQPLRGFGTWAARAVTTLIRDPRAEIRSRRLDLTLVPRSTTRPASA